LIIQPEHILLQWRTVFVALGGIFVGLLLFVYKTVVKHFLLCLYTYCCCML